MTDNTWLSQPAATPYPDGDPHPLLRRALILKLGDSMSLEGAEQWVSELLAEAERRGAERGWNEGWHAAGEAFVEGMTAARDGRDCPPSGDGPPNPYRKHSSAVLPAQEPVDVAGEGHDTEGGAE